MASDLTIRQLDPRRIDAVQPLWLALRDHHHDVTPGWGPVRDDADSWARRRADYLRWLAEDDAFCLVAHEGGPVADDDPHAGPPLGYALVSVHGASPTWASVERFGYVQTLSVAPGARGQGIGHELLRAVRARLAGIGVTRLELTVVAPNDAARRFYEREGFDVVFVTMGAETDPAS